MVDEIINFKISELRSYAKSKGLRGCTHLRKKELIDFLKEYEEYKSEVEDFGWEIEFVPENFRTF